jgi:hypothetical protein
MTASQRLRPRDLECVDNHAAKTASTRLAPASRSPIHEREGLYTMRQFLGMDIGKDSIKVALVDDAGDVLKTSSLQ